MSIIKNAITWEHFDTAWKIKPEKNRIVKPEKELFQAGTSV
jgi:hypothetical protein